MIKKFFTDSLLAAGTPYVDFTQYRRILLTNALLYITALVLFVFAVLNFTLLHNYYVGVLDIIAGLISIYGIIYYRITHNIERAVHIGTINMFVFFIPFTLVNQNESFGLVWTVVFPLLAMQVNGRSRGLMYVAGFYTILWIAAFEGIGVWQDGLWDFTSYSRLVIASMVVTYIVYSNELSHELTAHKLDALRALEQEHSDKLEALSITDPLTQLHNRRHFTQIVPKLLRRAHEKELYCGFFIVDVDFFKDYNDLYGHQAGDDALVQLSIVMQEHMRRKDDGLFRLGGEEFVGIMLSREKEFLYENTQAIIDAVHALKIPHSASKSGFLTVSIGLKVILPEEKIGLDAAYKLADDALYRAKSQGRSQVVHS